MRQNGEPSVEEILQSIKKVISRDMAGLRGQSVPTGMAAETASNRYEESVLELDEAEALDAGYPETPSPEAESLLQPQARKSMQDSLAALAMLSEPGSKPKIVRSGETSLEDMVRELLRPALAEWLDRNLPPMVERLVADEIARIVGKKG
ncbi:DUF2497 domain-containing protein [Novosphingobium profundi]|uniref:DUF2497 domain-containing protein n=1 Tax=Novosphingobium profundi TaxID=1774954 RepID=UPI001BDB6935|nr:DUF2497 domain-containing protein [Novosphingobium profundi]MBT0668878.1 DUF2497 domain-containing protein [Novosphingobium profundi]